MFKAYDFVYDNISSLSQNVKLLYLDNVGFSSSIGSSEKEYRMIKGYNSSRWKMNGVTMANPFSFEVQILFHNKVKSSFIKRNQVHIINKWLFNKTNFKRLQIIQEGLENLYFMAVFKTPEILYSNGEIIGYKTTVLCDNTGAYEDRRLEKNCFNQMSFKEICSHDGVFEIFPTYKIQANSSEFSIQINDVEMSFQNISIGSNITIDTQTLIVKSDTDNLFVGGKFNLVFPTMVDGENEFKLSGNIKLIVEYSLIKEVGS